MKRAMFPDCRCSSAMSAPSARSKIPLHMPHVRKPAITARMLRSMLRGPFKKHSKSSLCSACRSKHDAALPKKLREPVGEIGGDAVHAPLQQTFPVAWVIDRPRNYTDAGGVTCFHNRPVDELKVGAVRFGP